MATAQELNDLADELSRAFKGLPRNWTYARGIIGSTVKELRRLADQSASQAAWSMPVGEPCDYPGCIMVH